MKKISTILLSFFACFCIMFASACTLNKSKGDFSDEIIVSVNDTIDIFNYLTLENVKEKDVDIKFSDSSIVEEKDGEFTAKSSGESYVYAVYEKKTLATTTLVIKSNYSTPVNLRVNDTGLVEWNKVYGIYGEKEYYADYKIRLSYNNGEFEEVDCDTNSYQLDENKKGKYVVQVKALGTKYFDESEYCDSIAFNYYAMEKLKSSDLTWENGTNTLSWKEVSDAKYKIKVNGVLFDSENFIDVNTKVLNFTEINPGETINVSVVVYDDSDNEYLETESESISLTKIGKTTPTYNSTGENKGTISWTNVEEASHYLIEFISLTNNDQNNKVIKTSNLSSSFDDLESDIYKVTITAINDSTEEYFINGDVVTLVENVVKLDSLTLKPYGEVDGVLQLEVVLNDNTYLSNIYLVCKNKETNNKLYINSDLISAGEEGNEKYLISLNLPESGVYDVEAYAMPILDEQSEVKSYIQSGITAKYVLRSNVSNTQTVYRIKEFFEEEGQTLMHAILENGNSTLSFYKFENATMFDVTINEENVYTFNLEEDSNIQFVDNIIILDLGFYIPSAIEPIEEFDNKFYNISVRAYRNDKVTISSLTTKILTILKVTDNGSTNGSSIFEFNLVENADSYDVYTYEITAEQYKKYKDEGTIDVTSIVPTKVATTSNSVRSLNYGYYLFRIYSKNNIQNDYLNSIEYAEFADYVTENLVAPTIELGYNEDDYSFADNYSGYYLNLTRKNIRDEADDNTDKYLIQYLIKVYINDMSEVVEEATIERTGNVVKYKFNTAFDNQDTSYCIEVITTAKNSTEDLILADASILNDSESTSFNIKRINTPTIADITVEEDILNIDTELNIILGVSKIYLSNTKETKTFDENKATYNINSFDGKFDINIKYIGNTQDESTKIFEITEGTIYLDSEMETFTFVRSATPVDLKYESGKVSFTHQDNGDIKAYNDFYRIVFIFKDEELNSYEFDIDLNLQSNSLNIDAVYAGSNIDNISLEVSEEEFAEILTEEETLKTIDIQTLINILLERLSVTISESTENIFANSYQQANDFTINLYSYNSIYNEEDQVFTTSSRLARTFADGDSTNLKIEKMAAPTLSFKEEDAENYYFTITFEKEITGTTYEAYLLVDGEESKIDNYNVDVIRVSKTDLEVSKQYFIYARAQHKNYFDSNNSKEIGLYRLSAIKQLTLKDGDATHAKIQYIIPDLNYVSHVDINGTNNGTNLTYKITSDGMYSIKLVGRDYEQDGITYYVADSDTHSINMTKMAGTSQSVAVENNEISFTGLSYSNIRYFVIFEYTINTQTQYHIIDIEENTSLNLLTYAENLANNISAGDVKYYIYGTITNTVINLEIDENRNYNDAITAENGTKYYNTVKLGEGTTKKLTSPEIKSIEFITDSANDNKIEAIQTSKVKLTWEGNYGTTSTFEISLNNEVVSPETYVVTNEGTNKYSTIITNDIFESYEYGLNILKLKVTNTTAINSTPITAYIYRFTSSTDVTLSADRILTISTVEVFSEEQEFMIGLTYENIDGTTESTYFAKKFGTQSGVDLENHTGTFNYDISDEIYSISNGKSGKLQISVILNNLNISNFGHKYYMGAMNAFTIDEEINILGTIDTANIEITSNEISILNGNSGEIYMFSVKGISAETNNFSLNDVEFDYTAFNYEFTEEWVNGTYEISIYSRQDGFISSIPYVYEFTLQRLNSIQEVLFNRGVNAETSEEEIKIYWALDSAASGYYIEVYETTQEIDENDIEFTEFSSIIGNYSLDFSELGFSIESLKLTPYYININGSDYFTISFSELQDRCSIELEYGYYLFKIKVLGSVNKTGNNYSKLNSHIYNFVVFVPENTVNNIVVSNTNYRDLTWNGENGVTYYVEIDGVQYIVSGTSMDATEAVEIDEETLENPGGKVFSVSVKAKGNLSTERFSTETGIVYMDSESFESYVYKISGIKTIEETVYDSANNELYVEGETPEGGEGGETPPEEPPVDPEEPPIDPENPEGGEGEGEGEGEEERPEPIIESGYVKIALHPNNTEINLDEIKFYAGLYDTEDEVLKNSVEFAPTKIENPEEFPYVVRLEELISLLNISPTAKGTNELQTIAIWIIYTNEIQANDPNFDTFRSYCLRSNLYEYSFIYEEDEITTSGDNTLITSLYEYYEWTDTNVNFGNYAEKYFVTPIESEESTNEELVGFWARIKYKELVTDEEGNEQEVEQVKYTYISKEDCVDGYIVNKEGNKFFSKKDESGNTDGLITGEAATPSESPTKTLSCYGINLDKILTGLNEGNYTVSISKYCNITNGTTKYQKQYDWIGNENFDKLPSVQSVYMSKGVIYWNDDGIDTTNIDYYYLYFYPTDEEGFNPKLKILSSSINYFDPSNYILNDRTKYKVAVVAVSKKERYAPSNKMYVTNSNGVSVEIIKNLIDTTNIIKVDEKGSIYFDWAGTEFYTDINTLIGLSGEEATEHFTKMLDKVYYSPIAFTINNLVQENYYNIQFKFEGLDSSQKPYFATINFANLLKQEFNIKDLEKYEGLSEDPTGQEKYLGLVKALGEGSGVANEKTLFDDFANNVPHGEYKISYRVLGTSSTISSRYCQIVTLENDEEPAEEGNFKYDTYYVVNAPIIKTRLLKSDDGKVYAFMFRQISVPTSKGATPTPATSYVIHVGDRYNYYVNLKTDETNKWQCTFEGKTFDVLTCTDTGMIDENGDYILVYVNYLTESIVEKFSPEKATYNVSVFVVGNGYCLGSKSDCIKIDLQSFGNNFTIVNGQFIWDTHGFDTKVILSRGEENPPEEIVPVDDNGETSTFNLDKYPAGIYEYICFFVEGTRTANSLVVDSEKYYVYNVVKLSTPTISTYKGNIYIDDQINSNAIVGAGWEPSISKYVYNIYNDASTEELSFDISSNNYTYIYEPGLLDIDEEDEDYAAIAEYKNTEKNAKQFYVRNNGTVSATISATKKIDENGRSYYDFTEESGKYKDESWTEEELKEETEANGGEVPDGWNGLLFSTNGNYLIMRSSLATLNAQMAKTITEITINENGDLTWDPVLINDNGKELYEDNVVYKIIVSNKIMSNGTEGEQIDLAPSSEIEIFYTKLNTFNVTKIKYGNGQGDDDTGEDLFKDFEKNPFLSISIQVLSLPNYDSSMIGQFEKIDLVEGGSVIANPVGGNNEGFLYKDSQDFALLSDRCTNEDAKFKRARPIEDDRLEILNKTLYNGNSGDLIAEAGDLHWSFMALEMGELLDYYNFIIEVVHNNQITYATGKFLAVPDIAKTKELKENEYADADANVKSNLRYFDVYFAFDDGILVGGNTYNINIYAHYKTEDVDPHIRSFGRTITMATKPLDVTTNHITITTKAEDNETYEEFSLQNYLARQIGSIGGYNYIIRMYYRFKGEEFISTNFIDFSTDKKTIKITNDINLPDGYDEATRTVNITSGQMEYYFYVMPNEISTNILRSDKSEIFYLQRPDWGENDKILWDDVTKSFSWDYTGVHSLISETQIYTLDGENLVEVTEEIINDDGEFETVGVKLGLDALVKLGNLYIATDGTEYIEISIDGDESEDVYYILKSQVSDPTYVITASYYNKNDFGSLIEQRVYQSALNRFIPEVVGYTSISVTVRLGASNIESVNKHFEIEITETNDDGEEVVVGTERGLANNNIFTSGEGSELNPYIISNANDFNNIRYRMNKESYLNNYNSITYDEGGNKTITTISAGTKFYFKQINNISITGVGVYFAQTSFSGDYTAVSNSGGTPYRISYTVSDISVLAKDYTWNFGMITSNDGGNTNIVYKHGISIFEELAVSANVHDLEVNLSISSQTVNTNVLIAGLAIENKGTIENFALNTMSSLLKTEKNSSAVVVYSGVVSYNNTGTLRNVKNKASMQLTVTQPNNYLFVSGITFMNYNAKIYDSTNEGDISVNFTTGNSTVVVAGLVINNQNGIVNYENAQGTGCINKGKLTVTSSASGQTTAYVAGGICWSKALASGTVNVSSTGVIEIGGTVQNKEISDTILRTV